MSEVWSKTPPSENGWYWVKTNRIPRACEPIERSPCGIRNGKEASVWSTGEHLQEDCTDAEMMRYGYEFGPSIPDASSLLLLKQKIASLHSDLAAANRRIADFERIHSVDTAYLNQH
jgi:hypothetical protein